jgi:hypothetical protein
MPFCINENLFLSFNTNNLGVAIRLKSIQVKHEDNEIIFLLDKQIHIDI